MTQRLFPACSKRQKIKLKKTTTFQPLNSSWWLNVLLLHSRTMFFHQQLCSPGTLIWQCVTWTRSFRCSKPNTLLSSLHRLKVSPVGTHKLPMCSFSCRGDGGSSAERRQGFCASADRFTTSVRDLSDLRAFGPQPKYGQGFCRRADLCHEALDEQPVTGTFPLTQLVFFFISVQFGQTHPWGFKEAVGSLCACFHPHSVI